MRSYGEIVTETHELNAFKSIEVGEKFRLYITQDTSLPESITITYGKNVIDGIKAVVTNGKLTIKDKNRYNWVRNLDVFPLCTLNVHKPEKIIALGASRIDCIDTLHVSGLDFQMMGVGSHRMVIDADVLTGSCTGPGNVEFIGRGGLLTWYCENGGWIDGRNLKSSDAYLWHYTEHDVHLDAEKILKAYVYNKGNVYYYREPTLEFVKQEFGSGRILKK
jgi:hypothetical protein